MIFNVVWRIWLKRNLHLFEDGRDKERLDAKEEDDKFWFGEENWFNPFFKFVSFVCVV